METLFGVHEPWSSLQPLLFLFQAIAKIEVLAEQAELHNYLFSAPYSELVPNSQFNDFIAVLMVSKISPNALAVQRS